MSAQASQQVLLDETAAQVAYAPQGLRSLTRDMLRKPTAAAAMFVIALLVVVAILAPLIAPHPPDDIDVVNTLASPSSDHLLGTDALGRDNLSRVLYGARVALEVALPSVLGAFFIGGTLGLLAGYLGGLLDKVLIVVFDALIAFPAVILGLALLTLLGPSIKSVVFVIALSLIPYYGRLTRAQALAEKRNQYVKAERSLGASRVRVLRRHIFPNVIPPLLIVVAMDIPGAVAIEAGLAFLGLGVQPPTSDWGVMLNDGFKDIGTTPWEILGPILALIIMTTAFTIAGESMRDVMDPRYRPPRRRLSNRKLPKIDV
jgi:peptide/nickel transport system permease protein